MTKLDDRAHIERHEFLHKALDELIADFIQHNIDKSLGNTTVMELMIWSYRQTCKPEENPHAELANLDDAAPRPNNVIITCTGCGEKFDIPQQMFDVNVEEEGRDCEWFCPTCLNLP